MVSRKKRLKNEDFKKVKLKVGKTNLAENQTDTTFKSKSIIVPGQSVGDDKGTATNQRNLTLKELLGQLRHYNNNIRKDAVAGLKDLFSRHGQVLRSELAIIIERVSPLVLDGDANVRHNLQALFTSILKEVPLERIRPFFPLTMVYLRSAMTHVREDISVGAFDFLDIFLHHAPALVTASCKGLLLNFIRVLEKPSQGLMGGKGQMSSTGEAVYRQSRDRLLERLRNFLQELIKHRTNGKRARENDSWMEDERTDEIFTMTYAPTKAICVEEINVYASSVLNNSHMYQLFGRDFQSADNVEQSTAGEFSMGISRNANIQSTSTISTSTVLEKQNKADAQADDYTWAELSKNDLENASQTFAFIKAVQPIIVRVWMEVAPVAFGPGSIPAWSTSQLESMLSILRLSWRWYYDLLKLETSADDAVVVQLDVSFLKDYARHFMVYFPYGRHSNNAKMVPVYRAMSLAMCDVFAVQLTLLCSTTVDIQEDASETWFKILLDYGEASLSEVNGQTPMSCIETLVSLVDAMLITPTLSQNAKRSLLMCGIKALQKIPPTNTNSTFLMGYMSKVFLSDRYATIEGIHNADPQSESEPNPLHSFVLCLPRLLWNLKGSPQHTTTAKMLIRAMRMAALKYPVFARPTELNMQSISALLHATVPVKGGKPRALFGPFIKMNPEMQLRFLDVFDQPEYLSSQILQRLLEANLQKSVSAGVVTYAIELVGRSTIKLAHSMCSRTTQGSIEETDLEDEDLSRIADYASFYATITAGRTRAGLKLYMSANEASRKVVGLDAIEMNICSFTDEIVDWDKNTQVCNAVFKSLSSIRAREEDDISRDLLQVDFSAVVAEGLLQTLQTCDVVCFDSALACLSIIYRCETKFSIGVCQDQIVEATLQVMAHGCAVGYSHFVNEFLLQYLPHNHVTAILSRACIILMNKDTLPSDSISVILALTLMLNSSRLLDAMSTHEATDTLRQIADTQSTLEGDHIRAFNASMTIVVGGNGIHGY
eukprot:CFRG4522T1